jgi:hypothetical protein
MSGMGLRRVIAAVAALAWPACRVFETTTHPPWGTRLSDTLAPLVAAVILALVLTSPAAHRKYVPGRQPRHARAPAVTMELMFAQLSRLSARISDLSLRCERSEARHDCTEARLRGALEVINETNEEAGYSAPDIDDTMPGTRRLRAVPRLEAQRGTG